MSTDFYNFFGTQWHLNKFSTIWDTYCPQRLCVFLHYRGENELDFRCWGKWPLKWKFSEMEMSFRIPRRDTEIRFVTKFGGNRPLRRCRKVIWFITQKNSGSAGLVPAPILPKMGRSRPKLPKTLNLVRIGCVLPDLFLKDWFFGPKSHYNIGIQPTIRKMRYENKLSAASNSQMSDYIGDPRSFFVKQFKLV